MKSSIPSAAPGRGRDLLVAMAALVAGAIVFLASPAAQACSSCFNLTARGRNAYYGTTVLLGLLPFLMGFAVLFWLRRAARRADVATNSAQPGSPSPPSPEPGSLH